MPTTTIHLLKAHPAQMRTTYDLDALASLTLQIYERDLDAWQPIVASANGQTTANGATSYHIISGHRRHMAQLLAFALRDWSQDHPETDITIEVVRTMLKTLVESLGSLEKVIASLLVKYSDKEISFVPFEGSQKAQILALQAANYGSEKPDMLGVAHSFQQAVEAGAPPEEIARNVGQHLNYVLNHLALAQIPTELAQLIATGELPMSVATAVADLPEPKRTGLAIFIVANVASSSGQAKGSLTAKAIKECANTLKKWSGLQQPLLVKHQSQRNMARALVRLWGQVVDAYPEDAYATAAMLIYRDVHEEPWSNKDKLTLWFQALGGDTYFKDGRIHWTAVVEYLITEVSCQACPIAQLPRQPLRSDLSQGQGGVLGMPCRVGETDSPANSGQAKRCLHGLAAEDSFDVRIPWDWSEHPGVVNEGGDYRVKSYEDLLAAWQAQAAKEQAEDEEASLPVAEDRQLVTPQTTKQTQAERPSPIDQPPADAEADPTQPVKETPISKQRTQIAAFMQQQEQLMVNHPFATPCSHCRHRLDSSPTKDDAVPHCAWAGRLRTVVFKVLQADDQNAPCIPVCRQFAPTPAWYERIPAHPSPPSLPRDWLKEQILHLVKSANQHGSNRNAFEFLTGRPLSASQSYDNWFNEQLAAQVGDLNQAQLFTLFVWAHAEWQRARGKAFSLPVNDQGMQFATYYERPYPMKETP